jgi:molecular chaperone GrpE
MKKGKSTKAEETKGQDHSEIARLSAEIGEKTKLAESRLDQLKRMQADFDNYRKNFERERENVIRQANEELIKNLLPLLDDLEMALKAAHDEKDREGLNLLHKKLVGILEKAGLKPIEAHGKKFDPYYHDVLLKQDSDREEGVVLEELQKGYMLNSKVLRHAKVKVSGAKQKEGC